MRCFLLSVILSLALITSSMAAVTINISSTTPLPVANLLTNPGFELGNAMPDSWSIVTGAQWIYTFGRVASGGHSGAYLRVQSKIAAIISAGFMSQTVTLSPNTTYTVGAWVRLRGGKAVIYIGHPVNPGEEVSALSWGTNPLVPDFVSFAATGSPEPDQWFWLSKDVVTGATENNLIIRLGVYQEVTDVDYDAAFLGVGYTTLTARASGGIFNRMIIKDDTGKVLWDSGVLPNPFSILTHTVNNVPTQVRYEVIVISTNGTETHKWYPE